MQERRSNGVSAEEAGLNIVKSTMPVPGGAKLVYCLSNGQYVGTLTYDCINPEALRLLGEDFVEFTREKTSGLVQPVPAAVSQILKPRR
jgi:hypothetical protein